MWVPKDKWGAIKVTVGAKGKWVQWICGGIPIGKAMYPRKGNEAN
jgi:hypothetical protein